jgi:histidine triad (HIT) family protein
MEDCIFCKIIKKEIPAEIVYENSYALAFLDIQPRSTGHVMVIPKEHAPDLLSLEEKLVGPLFFATRQVAKMIQIALLPDGLTFGINQGRASGQEVSHLHIHIMPRFHGDRGGPIQGVVDNPPKEDLKSIADKIRNVQ